MALYKKYVRRDNGMKFKHWFFFLFILGSSGSLFAQDKAILSIAITSDKEIVIVARSDCHREYGLAYPMTYQLDFPSGLNGLKAMEKHQTTETWVEISEKLSGDLFNAIEDVRFDYTNRRAYISSAFAGESDSLFLKIIDGSGNPVSIAYTGISKYYDNRRAVVTISCDDWADWNFDYISPLMYLFRSRGLYLTAGIITAPVNCSPATWHAMQLELDSGYVEAASHSRTHPDTPYVDPVGEVQGSAQDINHNLALPPLFCNDETGAQYVYTWIAPYGSYDSTIDLLLGASDYLAARLYTNGSTDNPREYFYGDSTLKRWNESSNHFYPFLPTVEIGAPSWGGGDTSLTSLDGLFDSIVAKGDVYHLMWHPQVIISDMNEAYLVDHLNYISGHSDLWYVNLGHLYLYHLIQGANVGTVVAVESKNAKRTVSSFGLFQNYPNPFNPTTLISYQLPVNSAVVLRVYDLLGREVAKLVDERQSAGTHSVSFNASNLPSGVYFYRLQAGVFSQSKKLLLVK